MIEYIMTIDDREKRNKLTRATIQVMGQLNPHLRDVNDFKHKLWDHLFIMSNFELDVDSPYPIPSRETLTRKPERLQYATNNITYRHYGRHIERMIEKAKDFPDGHEKDVLIKMIANHLKKSYLTWNRDAVTDEEIASHLELLSNGKLTLNEKVKLSNSQDILSKGVNKKKHQKNKPPKGHFQKKKNK